MTTFLLIRHASMDGLGERIVGRTAGIGLNAEGKVQAVRLAEELTRFEATAIYSSPVRRAQETAAIVACRQGKGFKVDEGLNEIDYGQWTGRSFEELRKLPEWARYNSHRDSARIPGGESMEHFRQRTSETLERIHKAHTSELIMIVSHADWIRAAAAYSCGAS